ncbi:uncharacterized protein LODBEIA_P22630 [Lodderomyces beijingensis]|uniref:Uncharacterized protein n=1 Tax=Lodderomyces beijingensis TaxID=1775926 RepID=A0ABP0ZIR9_9ASCO
MSLRLKKSNYASNLKVGLTAGIVVVVGAGLILNTFPHLKTSIYNYVTGGEDTSEDEDEKELQERPVVIESDYQVVNGDGDGDAGSGKTVELFQSEKAFNTDFINETSTWNESQLRDWLKSREVSPPSNASRGDLLSLVKAIAKNVDKI